MKAGVNLINFGPAASPEAMLRWTRVAEALGYHLVMTSDHVAVTPDVAARYPAPFYEPFVTLGWLAAKARRLELGTTVVIVPYRHPLEVARMTAQVDRLSGGRFIFGVGVGWARQEFEALGVPFEHRGPRTDEYVAALRELWIAAEPTFQGDFAQFHRAKSYPKPEQAGGIPIVIGGATEAAARRAGRIGDGFFPARGKPEQLQRLFDIVRAAAREAGRDPASIELTASGAFDVEAAKGYADIGVDRLLVPPLGFDPESLERGLRDFGEQVIAPMS